MLFVSFYGRELAKLKGAYKVEQSNLDEAIGPFWYAWSQFRRERF